MQQLLSTPTEALRDEPPNAKSEGEGSEIENRERGRERTGDREETRGQTHVLRRIRTRPAAHRTHISIAHHHTIADPNGKQAVVAIEQTNTPHSSNMYNKPTKTRTPV